MKIARPLRATGFAALALACLVLLGFGIALRGWDDVPRKIGELAGYVLFVILMLEADDSCRRGSLTRTHGGRS